jgi:YfiH family protein
VTHDTPAGIAADAAVTREPGVPLVVLVADCVPVLLYGDGGGCVGVAHAGWRGLAGGVIPSVMGRMGCQAGVSAWIGPSIGPCHYRVGDDVRERFPESDRCFTRSDEKGYWFMDLREETRRQLVDCGATQVTTLEVCTWCHDNRYFSYRRTPKTGRFAAVVWIRPDC